ncbi:methionyl-tRNA formyltransferase [Nonlabens sp.]|uniref:methionyl-tRNA formyltransferase n=1 Tax=Nonlabens sp. TaxID=1888209 RepID=UPI003F698C0D
MILGVLASGNLGLKILRELFSNYEIDFILTDSNSSEIIEFAEKENIFLFKGNPRNGEAFNSVGKRTIDVLLSINYLFLIEEDLIGLPRKIAINIHGSLLPKYRGRTPHVWAIINGEQEAGITLHEITSGCDEGKIIKQIRIPIDEEMTGADLLSIYNDEYLVNILNVLQEVEENSIELTEQNEDNATYFGKRTPEDGRINWEWSAKRITNWVRAQAHPYPGAFTYIGEEKVIIDKVKKSDFGFHYKTANGTIINDNPVIVKTADGSLELVEVRNNFKFKINQVFDI